MFDKHMICDDSISNVTENAAVVGFAFMARLPYYRGLGLSMVEDIGVAVDGEAVDRAAIRLTLRGRSWTLDELETEYGDRWNYGEIGKVTVLRKGGLAPGSHRLRLSERLRISYLPFLPTTTCEKVVVVA